MPNPEQLLQINIVYLTDTRDFLFYVDLVHGFLGLARRTSVSVADGSHFVAVVQWHLIGQLLAQSDSHSVGANNLPGNDGPETIVNQVDNDVSDLRVLSADETKDIGRDNDEGNVSEGEEEVGPEDQVFGTSPLRVPADIDWEEDGGQDEGSTNTEPDPAGNHINTDGDKDIEDVTSRTSSDGQDAEGGGSGAVGLEGTDLVARTLGGKAAEEGSPDVIDADATNSSEEPLNPRSADHISGIGGTRLLEESIVDLEKETDSEEDI